MKMLSRLFACAAISFYLLTPAASIFAAAAKAPMPTCQLQLNTSSITLGGSVTLKWASTNATAGAITSVGNVGPSGSVNLLPSSAAYTTYVGSFTGPGGTANCSATVAVTNSSGGTSLGSNANPVDVGSATNFTAPVTTPTAPTGALVTCGTGAFDPKNPTASATGCQACNLADLVQNIINFVIGLSIPIAAALFAWAGVLYFTSGANPTNKDKAKGIFKNAFVGFLIAITAWLVINTALHALLDRGQIFSGGNWFSISCAASARPVTGSISDVLTKVLGNAQVTNNVISTTPSIGGSAYVCYSGNISNPGLGAQATCVDNNGVNIGTPSLVQTSANSGLSCAQYGPGYAEAGGQCYSVDSNISAGPASSPSYGTAGALCSPDNPACSPAALQALGFEPQEADALSCIAVTESGGNPNTPDSKTGACGLYQFTSVTSKSNWQNPAYHGDGCSTNKSDCSVVNCQQQTLQTMFNEQGYQPWTGIDPNTGKPWNANARACVQKYDPAAYQSQVAN